MSRSPSEITDLVKTAHQSLRDALDDKETRWHQIEAGTFDYLKQIPKDLGEPVVAKRRGITELSAMMESIISWPLRPRVYLPGSGTTIEKLQDDLELYFAHALMRCDMSGNHRERRRFHMVHSRFGAE